MTVEEPVLELKTCYCCMTTCNHGCLRCHGNDLKARIAELEDISKKWALESAKLALNLKTKISQRDELLRKCLERIKFAAPFAALMGGIDADIVLKDLLWAEILTPPPAAKE